MKRDEERGGERKEMGGQYEDGTMKTQAEDECIFIAHTCISSIMLYDTLYHFIDPSHNCFQEETQSCTKH